MSWVEYIIRLIVGTIKIFVILKLFIITEKRVITFPWYDCIVYTFSLNNIRPIQI